MKKIVLTDELKSKLEIYQDSRKETLFKIRFPVANISLLRSIIKVKIFTSLTEIDDYLIVKASKIESFENFVKEEKKKKSSENLRHSICLNIIYFLSKQIQYLLNVESKCFYKIDPKNIVVIDNKFIYVSSDDLMEIEDKKLQINKIIDKKSGFISPELLKIKKIPEEISYKTIYYSLGIFIISILFKSKIDDLDLYNLNNSSREKILSLCEGIKESKLYYFLGRCLDNNIENRNLLYL